ncbi:MAG: histidine kinase [Rhodoferax sp.]|nr:histidine kinase [Rhodoferax sp.]
MKIDWLSKLTNFLQTMAFCLAVSAIQFAIQPERTYELPLVYSICIGTFIWAFIDFGRHLFTGTSDSGWPAGPAAVLLPMGAITGGFILGTLAGDAWFGWSSWGRPARAQLPVSIIITGIAGIVATYYFFSRSKAEYLARKMSEARRQASEAKLKLLETQLEPHMLFNTLANLRVLIGSDTARAQQMLDHVIAYLRATLNASRTSKHPLQAEFDRLRDYLELMAIRMGPRLRFRLELPDALARQSVPALLLQPLVENAIRHGLEPQVAGGQIDIRAARDGRHLVLDVCDTGVGMSGASQGDGFGLTQVRERLASAFDGQAALVLVPVPHGTHFRITLPLEA